MQTGSVLIVEDEAIIALDIRGALEQLGYLISGIAATGDEAIQLAAEHRPDLVLMDIRLPGTMDGIEAASRIREMLGIPVVFLTAYTDQATRDRANVARPAGYIKKPLHIDELRATVGRSIRRPGAEAPSQGGTGLSDQNSCDAD